MAPPVVAPDELGCGSVVESYSRCGAVAAGC
jgi:hypothetical protein